KFPRLQSGAKRSLVVLLNNYSVSFESLEAAREAWKYANQLSPKDAEKDEAPHLTYIKAFAGCQIARLTKTDNLSSAREFASQAKSLAEQALQEATEQKVELIVWSAQEVLRVIEAAFPTLAIDLDAAVIEDRRLT